MGAHTRRNGLPGLRRAGIALGALLVAVELGGRAYFAVHPERGLAHLPEHEQQAIRARDALETRPDNRGPLVLFYGDSTIAGAPFDPTFSPVKWLGLFLDDLEPQAHFRLVDFGREGATAADLAAAVRFGVRYEPDLVVVMVGNNEFRGHDARPHPLPSRVVRGVRGTAVGRLLGEGARWVRERARVVRLEREVARELERRDDEEGAARLASVSVAPARSGDELGDWEDEFFQPVEAPRRLPGSADADERIADLRFQLTSIVRTCRTHGIPVAIVSAPRNVRAAPRADCLRATGDELVMWKARVRRGLVHERADAPAQALEWYRRADAIDDTNAALAFRIAGCLERLGDLHGARAEYERAIHFDLAHARLFDDVEAAIRTICAELRVPYLRGQDALARHDEDGILGYTSFVDPVHLTLRGQHRLAQELARFLHVSSDVVRVDPAGLPRDYEADLARFEVGPDFDYETSRRLGDGAGADLDAALTHYERAWDLRPDPELGLRALDLCRAHGRLEEAARWRNALATTREE